LVYYWRRRGKGEVKVTTATPNGRKKKTMEKVTVEELAECFNGGQYACLGELWKEHEKTCKGAFMGEDINKGSPEYQATLAAFDAVNNPRLELVRAVRLAFGVEWEFVYDDFPKVRFSVSPWDWAKNAPMRKLLNVG